MHDSGVTEVPLTLEIPAGTISALEQCVLEAREDAEAARGSGPAALGERREHEILI